MGSIRTCDAIRSCWPGWRDYNWDASTLTGGVFILSREGKQLNSNSWQGGGVRTCCGKLRGGRRSYKMASLCMMSVLLCTWR